MRGIPRPILFKLATSERFERSVRGAPGGERVAYSLASRYVAGTTAGDALATARRLAAKAVHSSIDFFGENVTDPDEADRVADAYVALAGRLAADAPPGTYLSIDLSHIGIDEPGDGAERRLERIAGALPAGARIQVGAEQAGRVDRILDAVLAVARGGGPVAATVQANLRRSPADADKLAEAGVPIRLVKGAYVETPALAHAWGDETDIAFIDLAYALHNAGATLSLGTHDPVIREALLPALGGAVVEMLLGVRSEELEPLAARGVPVRVYVPYGDRWFRYAMRRAAESRGAP
ncbi:MAG TPA: proline dehydrogenase family protein [Solirubrobacteraceae bacterium]|nr:proline dehydrogenase family protein [Solirubrobacteraceae bacterium]